MSTYRHVLFAIILLCAWIAIPLVTYGAAKPLNNLGLVGYWPFNEGTSTRAYDISGQNASSTIIGNPIWVDGRRGKALDFDGVDDYVITSLDRSSFSSMTVTAWFKYEGSVSDSYRAIIGGQSANFFIGKHTGSSNIGVQDGGYNSAMAIGTNAWDGNWHHIAYTFTGGTGTVYLDGVSVGSGAFGGGSGQIWIAQELESSGYDFNGKIDDVRFYNRALTLAEIRTIYGTGQVTRQTVSNNGLVGWWRFDEATSTRANDFSGNGNHATLTNMDAPTDWIGGKRGGALDFDGTNDYVDTGSTLGLSNNSPFSYSVWFKLSGSQQTRTIIGRHNDATGGASLGIDDAAADRLKFHLNSYASQRVNSTGTFNDGRWHHAVGTWDGDILRLYVDGVLDASSDVSNTLTFPALNFQIGRWVGGSSQYFNGQIDDPRVYNRALSATEVADLYRQNQTEMGGSQEKSVSNGLVGYWSFNGKDIDWARNRAWDRSGRGLHGSIVNMGTTTAPVRGKVGQALNFAGSTEYIEVPQPLSGTPFTIAMWFYPNAINGSYEILYSGTDNIDLQLFFHQTSKELTTSIENDERGAGLILTSSTINKWHHIVWTYDGARRRVYINGAVTHDTADTTSLTINDSNVRFGKLLNGLGYTLQGRIDEIRVYNRALSDVEAKRLYTMGR